MSYSIFIWHQVILAYYRYSISGELSVSFILWNVLLTVVISIASFYFIEKRIVVSRNAIIGWAIAAILLIIPSGWIYMHAGVVRDVPELGIDKNNVHKGMFAEYCDRIYQYDKDFVSDDSKIKVLVEGISFGRDFGNVLLESEYVDQIELSYIFAWEQNDYSKRIKEADVICTFSDKDFVPQYVWNGKKPDTKIYGIGTKNFGGCLGCIFVHRNDEDYFKKTIRPINGYFQLNKIWKEKWGENYIDFMKPVDMGNGTVKVFTPDHFYISADGGHLTQAGAKWYARVLDLDKVFNSIRK